MLHVKRKAELLGHNRKLTCCLSIAFTNRTSPDFELRLENFRNRCNNIYRGCGYPAFQVTYLCASVFVGKSGGNLRTERRLAHFR